MFDNVGKNQNRSARRQLAALLLALLSVSTVLSVLVWAASRVVEVIEDKEEILEVPVSLAAPPPPPPPPGGSKKPKSEKKKPDVKPQEDVPQEVKPLEEAPKEEEQTASEEEGQAGGQEGGQVGGEEGGKVGGVVGSHGDTLGAPVVKSVHYSAVSPKVKPTAEFPQAAIALGMKDEFCQVEVEIDEEGKPFSAHAREGKCPSVFQATAEAGALRSEFYPYIADGKPMRVKFIWNFHFISK